MTKPNKRGLNNASDGILIRIGGTDSLTQRTKLCSTIGLDELTEVPKMLFYGGRAFSGYRIAVRVQCNFLWKTLPPPNDLTSSKRLQFFSENV